MINEQNNLEYYEVLTYFFPDKNRDNIIKSLNILIDKISISKINDIINTFYTIKNSNKFINELNDFINKFKDSKLLLHFFDIDLSKNISIICKENLDDGIDIFQNKINNLIKEYIQYNNIDDIINFKNNSSQFFQNIILILSNWFNLLLSNTNIPNNFSELILKKISENFIYIYNFLLQLDSSMIQIITNKFELIKLLANNTTKLIDILKTLNEKKFENLLMFVDMNNTNIQKKLPNNINEKKNIIILYINNYIFSNIINVTNLFNQLLLMFFVLILINNYKN